MLSPLLGHEDARDSYETLADSFFAYSEVMRQFEKYDASTQKRIRSDLKRDVAALQNSLTLTDQEKLSTGFRSPAIEGAMQQIKRLYFDENIVLAASHSQLAPELKDFEMEKYLTKGKVLEFDVEISKSQAKRYWTNISFPRASEKQEPTIVMSNA